MIASAPPSDRQAFAFELQVVTCSECGAPVVLGSAGVPGRCDFCHAPQRGHATARAVPRAAPRDESTRLAHLRAQDTKRIEPPAELAELFVGVELLPWKVGPALDAWKLARRQATEHRLPPVEERLHRLTLGLATHFMSEGDLLRARSLLETAEETVGAPHLRQSLCAALARAACRAGDLSAAEAWLGLCDEAPDSLGADSAYRFARALLDTRLQRFDRVLGVLGANVGDVPIDNELEAECVALRANAVERSGRAAQAVDMLDHFFAHASALQRHSLRRFVAKEMLCPRGMRGAEKRVLARRTKAAERASGALFVAAGITVAAGLITVVTAGTLAVFGKWEVAHSLGGIFTLITMTFATLVVIEWRKWSRARRIQRNGRSAIARVVHARSTGVITVGVPQLLYRVLVMPDPGAPFLGHATFHASERDRKRFCRGAVVVVRYDEAQRGDVHFELDAA